MKLHRGQCQPIWENISPHGFNWGSIRKVETLSLGTLGNSIFKSCQEKLMLLCDIVFVLLNLWRSCWESIHGFQLGKHLENWNPNLGNFGEFNVVGNTIFCLLNLWMSCWENICEVVVKELIMCKTKMAYWESLERFDLTIFTKHH
jgi:hypothetical protein